MMKKMMIPALLALSCSACVSGRDFSQWLIFEKPLQVTEVRRSQQCGATDKATRVYFLSDLTAVKAWEQGRNMSLTSMPGSNLVNGPYALIDLGQRTTAGYGLAVSRSAGRRKDAVALKATFIEPTAGHEQAEMITSPCALVSLPPRTYSEVDVIDQDNKLRASTDDN